MTAETIGRALGRRKAGGGWMARCPAHDDREPSLSIRDADDGKALIRCHAGCDQGRVIPTLRARGLWDENGHRHFMRPASRAVANNQPDRDDYLPPSPTLRFHAGLKHPSGSIWPAMVALVPRGEDDSPLAIHRTFLARDGGDVMGAQ